MSAKYQMVIGLEVHCQLKTSSKLFCSCPTDAFGAVANTRVCPVCTGQPGTLPVLNRRAVELAYRAALGLGCSLQDSIFARKNYFYPDLPKGYQISQYEEPFSKDGALEIPRRIRIHRIHLEEDAGKLVHDIAGGGSLEGSLVDFNRAGVPLIEIVSEADMRTPDEAYQYLTTLKSILQYLDVSNCDMEKGEMRCDANVSLRADENAPFGTKAEVKNLNSFKNVKEALEYEFDRQAQLLDSGGRVVQETRLWDAERGVTESMRSKEEAHDYRYFPDPDLVPLTAKPELVAKIKDALPELPQVRRTRFASQYKLSDYDANLLTSERALADYFEKAAAASGGGNEKAAANWIGTDLLGKLNAGGLSIKDCPLPPDRIGELVQLIAKGTLSSKLAKEVFSKMWETKQAPGEIVKASGMSQVSDEGQIREWVAAAIAENPRAVEDVRAGKERAIGAIVGSVMKKSKGKANPDLVNRLIQENIR